MDFVAIFYKYENGNVISWIFEWAFQHLVNEFKKYSGFFKKQEGNLDA